MRTEEIREKIVELLRAYRETGNQRFLLRAQRLLKEVSL